MTRIGGIATLVAVGAARLVCAAVGVSFRPPPARAPSARITSRRG